eukprot:scaffold53239_cov59-Phaeocystis_antarctica.AAC.3
MKRLGGWVKFGTLTKLRHAAATPLADFYVSSARELRPRRRLAPAASRLGPAQAPRPAHSAGRARLEAWEDSPREAGASDQTPSGRCSLSSPTTSSIRRRRTGALEARAAGPVILLTAHRHVPLVRQDSDEQAQGQGARRHHHQPPVRHSHPPLLSL